MTKPEYPMTQAIRHLRDKKVDFVPYLYDFREHGGTRHTAEELNVDEHSVIKTLVMETDSRQVLIVLMHGDLEVSTKELARQLGCKTVQPCDAATAEKNTGYLFGGTSPFGTKKALPIYMEKTIPELERIFINGGKRGFIIGMNPADLAGAIPYTLVNLGIFK